MSKVPATGWSHYVGFCGFCELFLLHQEDEAEPGKLKTRLFGESVTNYEYGSLGIPTWAGGKSIQDPAVRKNIRKVTVWMDTERGVSLKQLFDQGATTYRVSVYFDIKTNQPLPADAFTFKTDPNPTYVSH